LNDGVIICTEINNCVDYYYCVFCPAQAWLWGKIGRMEEIKDVKRKR